LRRALRRGENSLEKKLGSLDGRQISTEVPFAGFLAKRKAKGRNAGHDPTTTSFTELSAVRRFLPSYIGRIKRAKKQRERKNIEREKEKENRRVEGWENRYIEQRTR